jgi:hypothetical protein
MGKAVTISVVQILGSMGIVYRGHVGHKRSFFRKTEEA